MLKSTIAMVLLYGAAGQYGATYGKEGNPATILEDSSVAPGVCAVWAGEEFTVLGPNCQNKPTHTDLMAAMRSMIKEKKTREANIKFLTYDGCNSCECDGDLCMCTMLYCPRTDCKCVCAE